MAELYGCVVIEAPPSVLNEFLEHRNQGLEALVEYSKADPLINDDCDVFFETIDIRDNAVCFEFVDDYWSETAQKLAKTGTSIGIYLHSRDEYGAQFFLSKNRAGKMYSFFSGGPEDDFEIEGGDVVKNEDFKEWLGLIPESIQKKFPGLIGEP